MNDPDTGEVEPQLPLRLERGRLATLDSDLPRLAVDADLGRDVPFQSDLRGQADGELLPRDASGRFQGPEPVELGARRRVEVGGLFPCRDGLAFQLGRLPSVLAGGVERRSGCPCRADRPEVAGALALHLEGSDRVAVPGGGDPRIAQQSFPLPERRLPLVDVGRERRDFLFPLGQCLRGRDLLFVYLLAALQFQAPVLRLLLAQPPLLLSGAGLETAHLFSRGLDLESPLLGCRLGCSPRPVELGDPLGAGGKGGYVPVAAVEQPPERGRTRPRR